MKRDQHLLIALVIAILLVYLLTIQARGAEGFMRDPVLSIAENDTLSAWHFENPKLYDFLFKRKPLGRLMTKGEVETTNRWMSKNPELFAKMYGLAYPERAEGGISI